MDVLWRRMFDAGGSQNNRHCSDVQLCEHRGTVPYGRRGQNWR